MIVSPISFSSSDNVGKRGAIKSALINIAKNPIIWGILLGLPFSIVGIKLPPICTKTVSLIAQTATPVALLVVGATFKGRQAIKKIAPTAVATFIKLIGLPLIFLPVAYWLGFRNEAMVAIIVMLGSPATVTGYIMAKNMGNDEVLSSSIIVMSTVLSSLTLTLWIFVLRSLGLI